MLKALTLISCLGENTYPICASLADYLSAQTGIQVNFDQTTPWLAASEQLATGQIQMGWICGLLYTLQQDRQARYQVLAKPIFAGQHEPLYFSYLVVHQDSGIQTLTDLANKRLVINDPDSYSGHHAVWAYWAKLANPPQFASMSISGSHSHSLRMLAAGEADVAAIDCTVFDYWLQSSKPEMQAVLKQLRSIARINPAPTPPLVMHQSVAFETTQRIQKALLALNHSQWLAALQQAGLKGLVNASDQDYDVMRESYQLSMGFQ